MANIFDIHYQEANLFVKNLSLQLGKPDDTDYALRVLRSVMHALRSSITMYESMHIVAQLPLILKGIYVDDWDIDQPLSDANTMDDFLYLIRNFTGRSAGHDFANDEEAKEKIQTVFNALKQYISEGELDNIRDELPTEIAEMV